MILIALANNLLYAISNIGWKKSLTIAGHAHPVSVGASSAAFAVFASMFFILGGYVHMPSLLLLGCILLMKVACVIDLPLRQKIWKEEKVATILPFTNLSTLFTIILSFFLFHDASWITLGISLVAVAVVVISSMESGWSMPRALPALLADQAITAGTALLTSYTLQQHMTGADFFALSGMLYGLVFIIPVVYLLPRVRSDQKYFTKTFYTHRLSSLLLSNVSYYISLVVIAGLGLLVSTLLGFLYTGAMLLLSLLFFGEVPRKKDIILCIVLAILVALGAYFRH